MLSIQWVGSVVTAVLLVFVYSISVTLIEMGQAFLASRMGDDTAERSGWVSPNPLFHIDPIGILFSIFVFFLRFGQVRAIPLNTSAVKEPFKKLKIATIFVSYGFFSFLISAFSLTILVLRFGRDIISLAVGTFSFRSVPLYYIANSYSDKTSLEILFAAVLIIFFVYNAIIGPLSIVINGVRCAYIFRGERKPLYTAQFDFNFWILAFIAIILFIDPLRLVFVNLSKSFAIFFSGVFAF